MLSQKEKKAKKAKKAPTPIPAAGRSGAAPAPPGSARCAGRALRGPERGGCGNKAAVTAARQRPSCGEGRPRREPTAAVATSGGGHGKAARRCHGGGPRPRAGERRARSRGPDGAEGGGQKGEHGGASSGGAARAARSGDASGRAGTAALGPRGEHRADRGAEPRYCCRRGAAGGAAPGRTSPPSAQVRLRNLNFSPKKDPLPPSRSPDVTPKKESPQGRPVPGAGGCGAVHPD